MTVLRAKQAFAYVDVRGVPRNIKRGQLMSDTDPDVAKRRQLFEPVEDHVERVERVHRGVTVSEIATAEPNMRRSLSRGGRGKKSDEPAPAPVEPVVEPVAEPTETE